MPEYSGVAPAPPPRPTKRSRHIQEAVAVVQQFLPHEVILEHILTRVPAADVVRLRREWRAALISDHFVRAHHQAATVRAAAKAAPPEIVFFAPAAAGSTTTSFYATRLGPPPAQQQNGGSSSPAAPARELVTVGDMRADDLVVSGGTKACRGLTLLFQPSASAYHVCNLSTGEHVCLPPCPRAARVAPYGPYVLSSTGLGFDPAAGEHKVVRLFEDRRNKQPRCEVYGLRSGGWRPCRRAGQQVPPLAPRGLCSLPPVFVGGYFYWHMNIALNSDDYPTTPETILSLSVDTEQFGWVHPPEGRARHAFDLADLGSLCAVVDTSLSPEGLYELWTLTAAAGAGAGSTTTMTAAWSLRCRISLASLPMRAALRAGSLMLPLGSLPGGEILLATSCHEVYAYDPESNRVSWVFSTNDLVDTLTCQSTLPLNIAIHEEWVVTPVCRRTSTTGDDDVSRLKMKPGNQTVVARQGGRGPTDRRGDDVIVMLMRMFCVHQRDNNGPIRPNI